MDVRSITNSLYSLYNDLNRIIFNNELTQVEIIVASKGKSNSMGWYVPGNIWTSDRYEINICSEYVNLGIHRIAEILLHEMVHHYNCLNGINDCSRGGNYHNKKFRQEAEKRFLVVEHDEKFGYGITELSAKGIGIVDELKYQDVFKIRRKEYKGKVRKKSNSYKYKCPQYDTIVRASKQVEVLCGYCSTQYDLVQMELEDSEQNVE